MYYKVSHLTYNTALKSTDIAGRRFPFTCFTYKKTNKKTTVVQGGESERGGKNRLMESEGRNDIQI